MGSVSKQAIRQRLWLLAIDLVGMVKDIVEVCMRRKHIGVEMRRDRTAMFLQYRDCVSDDVELLECECHVVSK